MQKHLKIKFDFFKSDTLMTYILTGRKYYD